MAVRAVATTVVVLLAIVAMLPAVAIADDGPTRLLITYDEPVDTEIVLSDAGLSSRFRTASAHDEERRPSQVQVLEVSSQAAATTVRARLSGRDGVVAVEPDHLVRIDSGDAWGVGNRGQVIRGSAGQRGIDIGAVQAWPQVTGRGVVVAVLDTQVDLSHPLLRDRLWHNTAERDSGRDDDANGYVDDVHGWNFAVDGPNVLGAMSPDRHGTHVAGIIAGQEAPTHGFRGVAPDARLMPLGFIGADGAGRTSDAIRAIRYAVDNGADVINASFGSEHHSTALRTAMAEAGIPVVTSAGNSGVSHEERPVYPGAFGLANQLSVAAVDHTGGLADFSASSRRTVHVAAPGVAILSTIPGGRLAFASGTSMAAPFVTGAVALAIEADPDATPQEIVDAVHRGARPLSGAAETVSGGLARAAGTVAALGTPLPMCRTPCTAAFDDVGDGHVHRRAITCLATVGVTRGVSEHRYGAELGLTRAQVASLIARTIRHAGDRTPPPGSGPFRDIEGSVHRDAIEAMAQLGIVRGIDEDSYEPNRTVTRGEFAGIVARAAQHLAGADSRLSGPTFDDIAASPERAGIETASALSLVSGRSPGVFEPASPVRRDQAATMLVHLLDRLHQHGLVGAV